MARLRAAGAVFHAGAACLRADIDDRHRGGVGALAPAAPARGGGGGQHAGGHSQQFDVALEADAAAVRVAVLAFGQVLARLAWDGRELREERVRGWPPLITGALVLRDLQLVHWPVAAIRAALPPGWSLEADGGGRELRLAGRAMIRVRHPGPDRAELVNLAAGYRIALQSWGRNA
ncbi:MAG: DUF3261 domain-containing protein [Comamonadaceae bacterium]|nr:MAG: DUF3261 domain-containing protein [Comamonadaceae bacterium]